MTLPDWDSSKYLVDFEDIRFSGNLVETPFIGKVVRVGQYLHDIVFPDMGRALNGGGELSSLLMMFALVEYLSGYYAGGQSRKQHFVSFSTRYLPGKYKPYLDAIYDQLRNGLVHNLTILNPWKASEVQFAIEKDSPLHLEIFNEKVVFSIRHFGLDLTRAWTEYGHDLIMRPTENKELVFNFEKRFNKNDGQSLGLVKTE